MSKKVKRTKQDPKHGAIPKLNPRHPLWQQMQDRMALGVYTFPQLAAWATGIGFPLTVEQIRRGLYRYTSQTYSVPLRVYPWLAEMVQHVLDDFIDWDKQLDAAAQEQTQLVGMVIEQMRGLRDRPEVVLGADGNPLVVTNENGVAHNVILPAHTLAQRIDIMEAAQRSVGRLFKMIVERAALHEEMRPQVPGQEGSEAAPSSFNSVYAIQDMDKLRVVMLETDRELRNGYRLLIKEAAEVGSPLPDPRPLLDEGEGAE